MNDILQRYEEQREQAVESAFLQPEKFDREYLKRYRDELLTEARRSIRFLQESLSMLSAMRDRIPFGDLETGELIHENIKLTQECIHAEMGHMAELREGI